MTGPTSKRAAAGGLIAVLAVAALVCSILGALEFALAALAVLVAAVGLLLLDVRHRQQVVSAQAKDIRGDIGALRHDVGAAVDGMSIAGARLTSLEEQTSRLGAITRTAAEEAAAARRQAGTIRRLVERIDGPLMTEMQALDQLLGRYAPRVPLPAVGGWALSPSGLLWLVDHVERTAPDVVVECGSGTSTLWLAQALRGKGHGRVIALEHDEAFAAKTRAILRAHDLDGWAEVRHAPLVDTETPRGDFLWYDVDPSTLGRIDVLVVDGPPQATGRLARYPALPVLGDQLSGGASILVDDAQRPDEKQAIEHWLQDDPRLFDHGHHGNAIRLLERR